MKHERLELKNYFDFIGANGENPVVETYLPYNMVEMNRQNQKRPCMVVCPGGGYGMCSERESEPIALQFLSEGFNVFVLTYSVAPHRFPTQLREVAATMELIYANAEEWNCDTEKIAIIGFSAGGHLAAHYSTMFDCKEVREVLPESKSVNASILAYPVIDADFNNTHQGSFMNLLGHAPDKAEEEYFSCNRQVKETTPPAFIWHTAEDGCVPVVNSISYAKALIEKKVPVELHIYPFGGHGLSTSDRQTIDNVTNIVAYNNVWLDSVKKWLRLIFEL
ncbi:MAG: alpha/beta hydrolase [Clostridia bacterium]|nr:alpha/beta hydrolase [Clostridia bacterium]